MNNKQLNNKLRELGAQDARQGKPIDTFLTHPLKRHTEQMRAAYEIGWRAHKLLTAKEEATERGYDKLASGWIGTDTEEAL
jgi:hypothetical protein